jgi:peptidyl-prolyl cis-trans isomerase B (cyclophilin B)
MRRFAFIVFGLVAAATVLGAQTAGTSKPSGASKPAATATARPALPMMVIETDKGTIEIQLFQPDAPKSVDHIIALVNKSFYRSQRFHRVETSVVQFGDPQSRDMTKQGSWGTGSSYNPIGVVELGKRKNVRGMVGLAHSGNARLADSQLYILKRANPMLDGQHVVIGQVVSGMAIVDKIERADMLKMVTIKAAGPN